MARLTKDTAIGIMLGLIDRSRNTPPGAQTAAAYLRPREAQLIADYIADLHHGIEVAMDIVNAEGDHVDNVTELKALHARTQNIEAERNKA